MSSTFDDWSRSMGALTTAESDHALRLSVVEGAMWAAMVGLAETYFLAAAVHLGAGPLGLGLTVALPLAVGAAGPLATLSLLRRVAGRRSWCLYAATLQALTLAALSILLSLHRLSVPALVAGICVYQISGQAAGTAWASWYGDLVPSAIRGRWFARRNRVVYLSTCLGLALAGGILQLVEPRGVRGADSATGFAILFGLAALFRAGSTLALARSPEPDFRGIPRPSLVLRFLRTSRGGQAVRILLLGALFHFTVYWSAPYFSPFMLEELRFTYAEYMASALCVIAFKALLTGPWGGLIDRGGAKRVFLIAMFCVALVPLPWILANGLASVLIAQMISGASWSGFEVGYFTLLLETSTRKTRPVVFAAQSIANGIFQLAGVVFASQLLFPRADGYREVFGLSVAGRTVLALASPFVLMGVREGSARLRTRLTLRLFGLRSNGGFSVRPVLVVPEEEEAEARAEKES